MFLQRNKQLKSGIAGSVVLCSALILTACGGGGDTASNSNTNNANSNVERPSIPSSEKSKVYRNAPQTASAETRVNAGDHVFFTYEMRNHSTDEVVEASPKEGIPHMIGFNSPGFQIPQALVNALQDSLVGETYWIFFPEGMEDLPEQLDQGEAYVVEYKITSKVGG